ncbi:MAG: hypothetical protein Q9174_002599 [Haloplaca sp. 1 TL-2023]
MNFAFGIGNYFRFTFSFQLGAPRAIKAELPKPEGSIASLSTSNDIVPYPPSSVAKTALQSSIDDVDQQVPYEAKPEDQLIPSLEDPFDSQQHEAAPEGTSHVDSSTEEDASSLLVTPAIAPTTQRRDLGTPSTGSILLEQSTMFPQTPPSTGRSVPPHDNRSKTQAKKHSNLDASLQKTRYLQSRTCGPRRKLPSLKSYKNQLATPPRSDTSCTPSKRPLTFLSLPLEIRNMIYRELLVSGTAIKKPHKLVWNKKSIMVSSLHPVKDIDSAILRACRTIYDEALPVLYGKNTFEFCKPRKLRDFSHGILDGRLTSMKYTSNPLLLDIPRYHCTNNKPFSLAEFAFRSSEAGRFTLIRSIILRLGYDRKPYIWQHTPQPQTPDRKKIWSHWYEYFFNSGDPRSEYSWCMHPGMQNNFPALDKLALDFSDWQLGPTDAIRVEPFIKKFGRSGGLSKVAIKGIQHQQNLDEFRKGLVKPGGSFTIMT